MRRSRIYPDEPTGPFPSPPVTFEDRHSRQIELRPLDGTDDRAVDALVEMYVQFDPEDRAQGIPPIGDSRVREWLEAIRSDGFHVAAWDDGDIIGHAMVVPDVDESGLDSDPHPQPINDVSAVEWELAIFVLQSHQRAGIGTQLLEHLLGYASDLGIERVWLTVERWNTPAIALYETVGFERCGTESFEQEMAIVLP